MMLPFHMNKKSILLLISILSVVTATTSFIRNTMLPVSSSSLISMNVHPKGTISSSNNNNNNNHNIYNNDGDNNIMKVLFGIRGGGLFGNNNKDETKTDDVVTSSETPVVKYPAMTQQEIEEWLEHIPVFAVTDMNGAGVILKPENDTSVFYFFLNPLQANATLQQLMSSHENMSLKVSAFSLGKIWFNLLQNVNTTNEVLVKSPTASSNDDESSSESIKSGVEYRLVPDSRDLLGARMLLTLSPEDGEKLKAGGSNSMTPEMIQSAITKAMTESPKFKTTYNEIPVFTIAQMRMQKQSKDEDDASSSSSSSETSPPVTLLPMYFSLQNMVGTWQQFMAQAPTDIQNVEPAINLMSLHDIIAMMTSESEIDWRHVVLVPPTNSNNNSPDGSSTSSSAAASDPVAQMGGATLGDDGVDDDDE